MSDQPVFVAVANGVYELPGARDLVRAVPDAERIAGVLEHRHGFTTRILADRTRGDLWRDIERELAPGSVPGGVLVVLWTGHARPAFDGSVRLIARDGEIAAPDRLVEWAALTGAAQTLVLLDICYSGEAVPDAVSTAYHVLQSRADNRHHWFGIFAVCRPDELALSGALAPEVVRLLEDGPGEALRAGWLAAGPAVDGEVFLKALYDEWSEPRQAPQPAQLGGAGAMFANPLYPRDWNEGVVEHLLQAARGTSMVANYFVGRERPLAVLVARLKEERSGVVLITGPAGCGKSAVLGRIVSLSDQHEREAILAGVPPPAELDPDERRVDAHLHLRNLRFDDIVRQLCLRLRVPGEGSIYELLAAARRRARESRPLVVALDGLDEADPLDAGRVAAELVAALGQEATVLVSSRPVAAGTDVVSQLNRPDEPPLVVDLGLDGRTLSDVRAYVEQRLAGVHDGMRPATVAEQIIEIVGEGGVDDGPFLLARLLTSQLREQPVDTGTPSWQDNLARSVSAALERDLDYNVISVAGRPLPTAARELLTALACAQGSGFAADDDLWPAVASAISPTGQVYGHEEIVAVLRAFGRHIVVGRGSGGLAFRIAHQRLVDHLLDQRGAGRAGARAGEVPNAIARTVFDAYTRWLDAGAAPQAHEYLWFHAWRHFADAGDSGLALLEQLVERDRGAFLMDLAFALDRVGDVELYDGNMFRAAELQQREVEIWRELEPGGGPRLAEALFDVAYALSAAGQLSGSEAAAEEAVRLAWRFADERDGMVAVARALMARAMTRRAVGDFEAVCRFVDEADRLLTPFVDDVPELAILLAAVRILRAEAQMQLGDVDGAADRIQSALDVAAGAVDEVGPAMELEAYGMQGLIQIRRRVDWVNSGAIGDPPALTAARRLRDLVDRVPADGVLIEILLSDAIRVVVDAALLPPRGSDLPDDDECRALLGRAIDLARPHSREGALPAIGFALCVGARDRLGEPDGDLLAEAIELLRPYVGRNAQAALALAQVLLLDAHNEARPAAERIGRLVEAADWIGHVPAQAVQAVRYQCLVTAAALAMQTGDRAMTIRALEGAVDALERSVPPLPDGDVRIGMILVDLGVFLLDNRAHEGIRMLRRADELLSAPPTATLPEPMRQTIPGLRAHARLSLTRTRRALGERVETGEVQEVLGLVDGIDGPTASFVRGQALALQLDIALDEGEAGEDLVRTAREVKGLMDGGPIVDLGVNRLTRLCTSLRIARALYADGRVAEAHDELRTGAPAVDVPDDDTDRLQLALTVSLVAADLPDDLLAELGIDAGLRADIRLMWSGPRVGTDAVVERVVAALAEPGSRLRRGVIRDVARRRRAVDADGFDRAWVERTGEAIPEWLRVTVAHGHLVVGWLTRETWWDSWVFLDDHPELLDASTDVCLDEVSDSADAVAIHREILGAARAGDAGPVFTRLMAEGIVNTWVGLPLGLILDEENAEELMELMPALSGSLDAARYPEYAAVLTLVGRGERALAARIVAERVPWPELLRAAWRSDDPERLLALADLCLWSERSNDADRTLSDTARAIALACLGRVEEAEAALAAATGARTDMRNAVSDAIAYDSGRHSDALIRLIVGLREN